MKIYGMFQEEGTAGHQGGNLIYSITPSRSVWSLSGHQGRGRKEKGLGKRPHEKQGSPTPKSRTRLDCNSKRELGRIEEGERQGSQQASLHLLLPPSLVLLLELYLLSDRAKGWSTDTNPTVTCTFKGSAQAPYENHPETIPSPHPSPWKKIVPHETGPWCHKGWDRWGKGCAGNAKRFQFPSKNVWPGEYQVLWFTCCTPFLGC